MIIIIQSGFGNDAPDIRCFSIGRHHAKVQKVTHFLSLSTSGDGFARLDHLRKDTFHEGLDLKSAGNEAAESTAKSGVFPANTY
ncbi:MAG: hypothetical protein L3J59_11085 [Methylococcaceae bacterium]|nr:hypothetical protein [Methylococcaceae bacterium]